MPGRCCCTGWPIGSDSRRGWRGRCRRARAAGGGTGRQRPGGFPWIRVACRVLTGWLVLDLDATIITSASTKEGAAPTFKGTFGFHPLAGWLANTGGALAMLLRAGNASANTVSDHTHVLTSALAQIPEVSRAKILVRVDGAGPPTACSNTWKR